MLKRGIAVIAVLMLVSLFAFVKKPASVPTAENSIALETAVWPENDYTQGLPVPKGEVEWAVLDARHCSVSIAEISEGDCADYRAQLEEMGFAVVEEATEKIDGQNYVSENALLSDGERSLSLSYSPGSLVIYISFAAI